MENNVKLNILVYGAGVIGSLYAAKLHAAGHDVSVLARRQRLKEIDSFGIILERVSDSKKIIARVKVKQSLDPGDAYDLVIIAVRKDQVDAVLPELSANTGTETFMFMVNNPCGYSSWTKALGGKPFIAAFPGAGGTIEDGIVKYSIVPSFIQPTMLGESNGSETPRIQLIADLFKKAGFPVAVSSNMEAWQKSHVAWVGPVSHAIYMAGGDNRKLYDMKDVLYMAIRGIREGLGALRAGGVRVSPAWLKLIEIVPEALLVSALKILVCTTFFETVAVKHANNAKVEMAALAREFRILTDGISTPRENMLILMDYAFKNDLEQSLSQQH
jgi:2-dehydropantoate 2-reductase